MESARTFEWETRSLVLLAKKKRLDGVRFLMDDKTGGERVPHSFKVRGKRFKKDRKPSNRNLIRVTICLCARMMGKCHRRRNWSEEARKTKNEIVLVDKEWRYNRPTMG